MKETDEIYMEITRNRMAIMAVIVAMIPNFNDAEDVFQDTMLEIIRNKDRYDNSRPFLPWAKGIARNMARRYYAKRARIEEPLVSESLDILGDIIAEESEDEYWAKAMERLHICMGRLSTRNRKLLLLRYGKNLKGNSLARKVGLSDKSIRTTLFRLREFLRKCIEEEPVWT
jgi:RNA polymerase sigma-70 factor